MKKIDLYTEEKALSSYDYISLYSGNSEENIYTVYKYIYLTYDNIKKDIQERRDGKDLFNLEMLENWLTRKLELYSERVNRWAEGDWKLWSRSMVLSGIVCDAVRAFHNWHAFDNQADFVADTGKTVLERLDDEYKLNLIRDRVGAEVYDFLIEYYTSTETKNKSQKNKKAYAIKQLEQAVQSLV